jgi:DNA-binding NarL/FixJ family response regulator
LLTPVHATLVSMRDNRGAKSSCRVLAVDDHAMFAQGLLLLLTNARIAVDSAWARSREEALAACDKLAPQVIILDLGLPDTDAFGLAKEMLDRCAQARLLVLDERVRWLNVRAALAVGAAGYWPKSADFNDLAPAVEWIASGGCASCPEVEPYLTATDEGLTVRLPDGATPLSALTTRELQIMRLLAGQCSTRCTAAQLRLSVSTVENHKARIMRKLGLHRMTEMVRLAVREGLIMP